MKQIAIFLLIAILAFFWYKLYLNDGDLDKYISFFSSNSWEVISGDVNEIVSWSIEILNEIDDITTGLESSNTGYKMPVILDSERKETMGLTNRGGDSWVEWDAIVIWYLESNKKTFKDVPSLDCWVNFKWTSSETNNKCEEKTVYSLKVLDWSDKDVFSFDESKAQSICYENDQINFSAPSGKSFEEFKLSKDISQKLINSSKDKPLKLKLKAYMNWWYEPPFCWFWASNIEILE